MLRAGFEEGAWWLRSAESASEDGQGAFSFPLVQPAIS